MKTISPFRPSNGTPATRKGPESIVALPAGASGFPPRLKRAFNLPSIGSGRPATARSEPIGIAVAPARNDSAPSPANRMVPANWSSPLSTRRKVADWMVSFSSR